MQNRELNTCKHDIYSFLRFSLPTNTEPGGSALFVFAGYMKNAIAESSLRNSASAPEMWYCTVLGLMLSASAISL